MLHTSFVENETGFSRLCWELDDLKCRLSSESGCLELQLFQGEKLIAMWPCRDWTEAFVLSCAWKLDPPCWWPPVDLAA